MSSFVDTNVPAYALDGAHPAKQQVARELLRSRPRPYTSPQVLRELYVVATTKLDMRPADALAAVRSLQPTVSVVEDANLVLLAIESSRRWQISFWDALIVEASRRCGADTLLSEDLQNGMDFAGVTVRNPFADL